MENINIKKDNLSFLEFLSTLKWLVTFIFRLSPSVTVFAAIIKILLDLGPLVDAYIFARLLDGIIKIASVPNSSPNQIVPLLGVLLFYNLAFAGLNYAYMYFQSATSEYVALKSPSVFYKKIHSLGIQTLENPEVVNKIQRAREIMGMTAGDYDRTIGFFSRIITLIFAALIIFKTMPFIAFVIFAAMMPEMFSNRIHMRKTWRLYRDETENKRKAFWASASLSESANLQEITITSAYGYLSGVFRRFADRYLAANLKIIKSWQLFGFFFGSMTSIVSIFGYFIILKKLFNGLISVGSVTFQMRSLDIFIGNFLKTANNFTSLYERCVRINELKSIFEMNPAIEDGHINFSEIDKPPLIQFSDVDFKYPNSDKYVIKDLNLEIKPGEKIAIVGENGAGKTTLVKLLCHFYRVNNGTVSLNEININDIAIDGWYKNLSVLFQEYNHYSYLTLKENIYLGASYLPLDMDKIKLSAQKANVDGFVSNYKNGYDQVLSEKFKDGIRPSSGQWQKIAIARFFYRNSPVVIFDEPTASIDAVSESEIFGRIYDFFKDKTVIIISHRFSTVRNADKIYVLEKGGIIESGSHKELMKLKGKYYKAFNIQAEGYER